MELVISPIKKFYKGLDGEPNFLLNLPQLHLKLGKIVFIMGHNGSGKSVLLKLLAGEIHPSKGSVSVSLNGKPWQKTKKPIPIVRQKATENLALELTVKENLLLRVKANSFLEKVFPSIYLDKQVKSLIAPHNELSRKINQPCHNLSIGQKQTLAFLAVISQSSPLLLLDEFLSATDLVTSQLLQQLTKKYCEETPASILVVSHDIPLAEEYADRILILKKGLLLYDIDNSSHQKQNFIEQLLLK